MAFTPPSTFKPLSVYVPTETHVNQHVADLWRVTIHLDPPQISIGRKNYAIRGKLAKGNKNN
ncbi:hypothetical protein E2C01_033466 [Portunus trituberculatus]|uniref:Uncharacterized protein n=1 Tax=Portunus trituberculatus TaxID=210409 RepID=A0A5B7F5L8_PORTR|nr:hypothetical protein [Portunus trituberculatus]